MKNEILKQIIEQIKKYELTETFSDAEEFKKWASKLDKTQINNFLSLDMDLEEIKNLKSLLINLDLLNCKDYKQRVIAISTLKNGEGCWHLYDVLCKPNFLNSKHFYKDIEMLSKADTARYGLWILAKDSFINSPYHDEDLKLLVETHDVDKEKSCDFVVSDAIATVAANIDSIKSPYHQQDMKLIANSGSDCLQMSHSYPEHSLNNLAVNKVSLADKYHLENMKIIAENPKLSKFLYEIMTTPKLIKGVNYRKEIVALLSAKSKLTARAMYYYIVNPKRCFDSDNDFYKDYRYDMEAASFYCQERVSGKEDPDYIKNLFKINQIDDKFVMHYVSLLMNKDFIKSQYKKFDLELLGTITSKPTFMNLYRLMTNEQSLKGIHHKKDAVIISQTLSDGVRDLLLEKAVDEYSLKSGNHEYDMDYISKLKLGDIKKKIYNEMYHYLFIPKGINDPQHKEKLEQLFQGIIVDRGSDVSSYLDTLQKQIDDNSLDSPIIESVPNIHLKPKSKILNLFKRNIKK